MSRNTVLLFPGQGAYVPGVLNTLSQELPELRHTFQEVDAVAAEAGLASVSDAVASSPPLDRLLLDEPPHILQLTLYASAVGMHRLLAAQGLRPATLVGHSLGEIAALVCGGAFSFSEGAQIVLRRTDVVEGMNPGGAMLAVGATRERVRRLLDLVGDPDAVVAVENGPRQTVVSGSNTALEAVEAIAKPLRVPVVRLRSPFPFHSPLLADASRQLASQLDLLHQRPLTAPVYSPILGRHYTDGDRLTDALAAHLTQPVRFSAALATLKASGADLFVEAGIGNTLTKLVNATGPGTEAVACVEGRGDHLASFGRALERLAGLGAVATSVIPDQTELPVPDVPSEWSTMGKVADYVLACLTSGTPTVMANGQPHV